MRSPIWPMFRRPCNQVDQQAADICTIATPNVALLVEFASDGAPWTTNPRAIAMQSDVSFRALCEVSLLNERVMRFLLCLKRYCAFPGIVSIHPPVTSRPVYRLAAISRSSSVFL